MSYEYDPFEDAAYTVDTVLFDEVREEDEYEYVTRELGLGYVSYHDLLEMRIEEGKKDWMQLRTATDKFFMHYMFVVFLDAMYIINDRKMIVGKAKFEENKISLSQIDNCGRTVGEPVYLCLSARMLSALDNIGGYAAAYENELMISVHYFEYERQEIGAELDLLVEHAEEEEPCNGPLHDDRGREIRRKTAWTRKKKSDKKKKFGGNSQTRWKRMMQMHPLQLIEHCTSMNEELHGVQEHAGDDSQRKMHDILERAQKMVPPEAVQCIAVITQLVATSYIVIQTDDWSIQLAAIVSYFSAQLQNNLQLVGVLVSYIQAICRADEREVHEHSGTALRARALIRSPLFKHAGKIGCALVTAGFCEEKKIKLGAIHLFHARMMKEEEVDLDFLDSVLASLDFFLDRGRLCFQQQSINSLIFGDSPLEVLFDDIDTVRTRMLDYKLGNYETHYGDKPEVFETLVYGLPDRLKLLETVTVDRNEKSMLTGYKVALLKSVAEFMSHKDSFKCRIAPFNVKIFGTSGVGKTSVCTWSNHTMQKYNGFPCTPESTIYANDEEWDSNTTSSVISCVYDDFCNPLASKARRSPHDKTNKAQNNAPATAAMAEAEKKGKVKINYKFTLCTTNKEDLQAASWSESVKSVLRRWHVHVRVRIRPEHTNRDGMLEAVPDGTIQDCWLLDIRQPRYKKNSLGYETDDFSSWGYEPNPIPDNDPMALGIPFGAPMVGLPIAEYLRYLCWASKKHFELQNLIVQDLCNLEATLDYCERCKLPHVACCCSIGPKRPPCPDPDVGLTPTQEVVEHSGELYWIAAKSWMGVGEEPAKVFDYLWDWSSSTLKKVVQYTFPIVRSALWPTTNELQYACKATTAELMYHIKYIATPDVGLFSWWDFMPDSFFKSPIGRKIFWYVNRKSIPRSWSRASRCFVVLSAGAYAMGKAHWSLVPVSVGLSHWCVRARRAQHVARLQSIIDQRLDLDTAAPQVREMRREEYASAMCNWSTGTKWALSVAGLAAVGATVKLLMTAWSTMSVKEQAVLHPTSEEELTARNDAENVWFSEKTERLPSTMTGEQLLNALKGNMLFMKYKHDKTYSCNAFVLKTSWFLMPYHVWFPKMQQRSGNASFDITCTPVDSLDFEFYRADSKHACNRFMATLSFQRVVRVGTADLCLVHAPLGGTFRNALPYVASERHRVAGKPALYQRRGQDGMIEKWNGEITQYSLMSYPRLNGIVSWASVTSKSTRQWAPGDCSTIVVANTNEPVVVGLHTLGYPGEQILPWKSSYSSVAVVLTKEVLETLIVEYENRHSILPVENCGAVDIVSCGKVVPFKEEMPVGSPLRFVNSPTMCVLGALGSGSVTYRSRIKSTSIAALLEEAGFGPNRWSAPMMLSHEPNRPFIAWAKKISEPMGLFEDALLHQAVEDYVSVFPQMMALKPLMDTARVLSDTETINGIVGARFVDRMNMDTAMGFPYSKGKRHHMHLVSTNPHIYALNDDSLLVEVARSEMRYLAGDGCCHIFTAQQKDEVVVSGKEKVRVFCSAPAVLGFMIRKYYLGLVRVLSFFPLLSECAVGINCFGPEYEEMYQHTISFGTDRIMAGDYSSWDQKLTPQLVLAAFGMLIKMAERSGNYTDTDIKIMKGIAQDVAYPVVNVNGTLVRISGTNPSGQNLTAYVNSMVNSLLLRMCFFQVTGYTDFRRYVKAITYGDDVEAGVHKDASKFNFNTYRRWLAEKCMKFTDPHKCDDDNALDFITKDKSDFLKRRPNFVPEIGCHLGALDVSSILKSMYMWAPGDVSEKEMLRSVFTTAAHEMFAHGREKYEDFVLRLRKVAVEAEIHCEALLESYDERIEKWKARYLPSDESPTQEGARGAKAPFPEVGYHEYEELIGTEGMIARISSDPHSPLMGVLRGNTTPNKQGNEQKECASDEIHWTKTAELKPSDNIMVVEEHAVVEEDVPTEHDMAIQQYTLGDENLATIVKSVKDETFRYGVTADSDMGEFLARPIVVLNETWNAGAIDTQFSPFRAILNNPRVANRVTNYAYINATVNVKATVTGSSFHYGKAVVAYQPWPRRNHMTRQSSLHPTIHQVMQMPHICLDPGTEQGGEMSYRLLLPYNGIYLPQFNSTANDADVLYIREQNELKCLGENEWGVRIVIHAWLTDVELIMPTRENIQNLQEQAGEYSDKPMSSIASSMARTLVGLAKTPIIGPYALASSMIVEGTAALLKLFGFSRPSIACETLYVQNRPGGNTSHFNTVDTSTKLTLDVKQEVTVDPRVIGLEAEDEMTIVSFAKRPFYQHKAIWSTSDPARTTFYRFGVNPGQGVATAIGEKVLSPAGFVAAPFAKWRGTMYVRIEIVASAFHRGKLRIIYDPADKLVGRDDTGSDDNIRYSHIVDLSVSRDYEFCVGWGTSRPFLRTVPITRELAVLAYGSPDEEVDGFLSECNGFVGIQVQAPLVCAQPVPGTNSVYINVYTRFGDDFELADYDCKRTVAWCPVVEEQAGPADLSEAPRGVGVVGPDTDLCLNKVPEIDHGGKLDMIHFGESIVSIRQLVKRYFLHSRPTWDIEGTNYSTLYLRQQDFPYFRGPTSAGNAAGFNEYNLALVGHLNYFAACFLAYRGGIRWKSHVQNHNGAAIRACVGREPSPSSYNRSFVIMGDGWEGQYEIDTLNNCGRIDTGGVFLDPKLNPVLEYEVPYYTESKFRFVQNFSMTDNAGDPTSHHGWHKITVECAPRIVAPLFNESSTEFVVLENYVAAADDFSFHYFVCTPALTLYPLPEF